jgi:hypothetical protein
VDEVDPGVCRTSAWRVVEQPHTLLAEPLAQLVDIAHPVGQLLDAGTALVDELGDGAGVVERRHQLDLGAALRGAADRQHGLADTLILVDLLVQDDHAEVIVIPLDRDVEVGHGDSDVVDGGHQGTGEHRTYINLLGRHNLTLTSTGRFAICVIGHTDPGTRPWR